MSNATEAVAAGPVSAALEADLRAWVQKHGIVMWLDLANHYSAFVDRLALARRDGALPYDVRAFRGSHLELMLTLAGAAAASAQPLLVVHLPGFNEDSVRSTPLLELYAAGSQGARHANDRHRCRTGRHRGLPEPRRRDACRCRRLLTGRLSGGESGIARWLWETDAIGLLEALLAGDHALERLAAQLYEERSRRGIGSFALTRRIHGYWDRRDCEIDQVAVNDEARCLRVATIKRQATRLPRSLASLEEQISTFLLSHRQYADWRIERVAIAPRIDADLRRQIVERGCLAEDLVDLTENL